jgi:aryl-alcohol dehydrogenase-like predicted oxidoreductase
VSAPRVALGRSGLTVPRLVLGTLERGAPLSVDARRALVSAALDRGLDALDVAPLYGFGRVEAELGLVLRDVPRDRFTLLGKVGLRWDDGPGPVLFTDVDADGTRRAVRVDGRPASVIQEVDASLARLGVEHLDVVQIHHPDPTVPLADTLGALDRLREVGKVRAIGGSRFSRVQLEAARAALPTFASVQVEHGLLDRWAEAEVLPALAAAGVAGLGYSALGGGISAARRAARAGDARAQAIVDRVDAHLVPLAHARGVTPAAIAVAWAASRVGVSAVIVGPRTVAQLDGLAGATAIALDADTLDRLGRAFAPVARGLGLGARLRTWARARLERARAPASDRAR